MEHSVAGPLATRILGELGAEVIKVERPGTGDFARHWDGNVGGESAQFWWLNRFKKSVELDVKSPAGREALEGLLGEADVLLHNLAPPSASRLGLDQETTSRRFPRLLNCQISGYGADGPESARKAYDMLIQAEAGVMSLTGTPDRPMRVGVSISDVSSGLYAAVLVLAGIRERDRTGHARYIDVALIDSTLECLGPMLTSYLTSAVVYPRLPDQHHAIAPYGVFACADDNRVLIAIEQDGEWQRFCEDVIEDRSLASDERYLTNVGRLENREELAYEIALRLAAMPIELVVDKLSASGLAYARVNDVEHVADHPVVAHRQIVAQGHNAQGEPVAHLRGLAERVFARPAPDRDRPPLLGEDS